MAEPKPKYVVLGSAEDTRSGDEEWIRRAMKELIEAHHPHLIHAEIAVAWHLGINPDADGRLVLGRMRKASELERELHAWDAVLLLNGENWEFMSELQRRALIDHELCHLELSRDEDGEPKTDGHGKIRYRIRKHDLEEFREIVERYGTWKDDIAEFVESSKKLPLYRDQVKMRKPLRVVGGESE